MIDVPASDWKGRLETAAGKSEWKGEWKRRMEKANGKGEWKERGAELLGCSAAILPFIRSLLVAVDVKLEPGLVTQPDLLVVRTGELRKRSDYIRHLVLAAEVLSPSSARYDRVKKRPVYQRNRVSEYWILDEQSRTIERWRPGFRRRTTR